MAYPEQPPTLAHAIEVAAKTESFRGYHFLTDAGVPGFDGVGDAPFYSYAAIERESAKFAGGLRELGLKKGDRLAIIMPTNDDFVFTFFGALRAGVVPVPIYPPLGLGQLQGYLDNTTHIVDKSGATVLVTSGQIKALLGTVQAGASALRSVVTIDQLKSSNAPFVPEIIKPDDIAFLQFTSGSTSQPKGVTLTHANLMANVKCIMEDGLAINETDVGISWLPLFHDMGLIGFVLAPLVYHVPIAFLPPLLFLKRPVSWFQAFTKYSGSIAYAPNFAFALCTKRVRERELEGLDVSRWRIAGCGAEPIRPETLEGFANMFAQVGFRKEALLPSYGMAESSLAIAFTERDKGMQTIAVHGDKLWTEGRAEIVAEDNEAAIRLVSCGERFPSHDIQIFLPRDGAGDEASLTTLTTPLAPGVVGEIGIKGPSVMLGYWEDEAKTKETFTGEYLRTGDLGFLWENRLYICGRQKEVIIINGRNYYPQDVEWEASRIKGVRKGNVIAFGSRDASGEKEKVVVAYERQEGATAQTSDIATEIRKAVQEVVGITVDDVVELAAGVLPKTSSGKLQRAKARALYESGELGERKGVRDKDRLELVKQAAKSQLAYFKLAVFGDRKKK